MVQVHAELCWHRAAGYWVGTLRLLCNSSSTPFEKAFEAFEVWSKNDSSLRRTYALVPMSILVSVLYFFSSRAMLKRVSPLIFEVLWFNEFWHDGADKIDHGWMKHVYHRLLILELPQERVKILSCKHHECNVELRIRFPENRLEPLVSFRCTYRALESLMLRQKFQEIFLQNGRVVIILKSCFRRFLGGFFAIFLGVLGVFFIIF